jgi:hypothetical protein
MGFLVDPCDGVAVKLTFDFYGLTKTVGVYDRCALRFPQSQDPSSPDLGGSSVARSRADVRTELHEVSFVTENRQSFT